MKIVNECRIDFKYKLSPYIVSKIVFSNVVSTQIIENILEVKKNVNKTETNYFDILIYTVYICNISSSIVTNIFLQDNIPKSTRFIENSVTINNIKKKCANPEKGFYIGNLKSGKKVTVTFKVLVLPIYWGNAIRNYSTVEYDYIYNVEEAPIRVNKTSNSVKTNCENKLFTQISVGKTLRTHSHINEIINIKYNMRIIKTKVISILKSNLCTLLVIGKIEYKMCYKKRHHIRHIKDIWGFSTYMMVPIGINYLDTNEIKINIEYLSIDFVSKHKIFINANLLLYY
ncbi:DUF11 domain-containing protein [Clostridium sp. P21]|uniref:DUF11 domain-containing protein n=1 Tax=Clostridium muellerianum TaxID=2716538 RepID=A0A7Y0EFV7_9CLOT|nr:DUF11 domain-containing protein [Clostridium muellerianum]NMM62653.1 DUF11 domain-containing protein [Clostridium muellerianum]